LFREEMTGFRSQALAAFRVFVAIFSTAPVVEIEAITQKQLPPV
jgi:hypothetical protein